MKRELDKPPGIARKLATLAIICAALLGAVPAVASATTLWVSPATVKAPFNSCANPGYNSIEQAISVNTTSPTVHVCNGNYEEQLKVEKSVSLVGESAAVVMFPASPQNASTSCAFAHPGQSEQALV